MDKLSGVVLGCGTHQSLECGWGIVVSHLYYSALKSAEYCGECGFVHVLWLYVCLLISFCYVQFGPELSTAMSCQMASCSRKGVTSFHVLSFCCLRLNMLRNVPLFFGIQSIGIACLSAADIHHPGVVYRSILRSRSGRKPSGHLGNLCLNCFDSSIKGIS